MISVSEIARIAKVSKATAARVLSEQNQINVSPDTRKKVMDVAVRFNYRPNQVAKSFATGTTHMIGLVGYSLSDHFLGGVFSGVHEYLYPLGYDFQMLFWSPDVRDSERLLKSIVDRRLDGVIIAQDDETTDFSYLETLQSYGVPVVAVDREIPLGSISFVGSDDFGGAITATEYLIRKGHRRIVFAGVREKDQFILSTSRRRFEGYREAMMRNNLMPMPEWLIPRFTMREGYRQSYYEIIQKTPELPTAIFCNNDNIAADVMVACERSGLKVPGDVSLVGFSDEPISQILTPALTTIHQEPLSIGRKSAQILLERIKNKQSGKLIPAVEPSKIYLPTKLIERNSVKQI